MVRYKLAFCNRQQQLWASLVVSLTCTFLSMLIREQSPEVCDATKLHLYSTAWTIDFSNTAFLSAILYANFLQGLPMLL